MRIAIAGCGWTGAILANRLSHLGYPLDVYEPNKQPKTVCACGIPTSFLKDLAKKCGLNPEEYILWQAKELIVDFGSKTIHSETGNLCTFHKQKFVEDLVSQSNATFHFGEKFPLFKFPEYDLIVDATGTRGLLGKLPTDNYYLTYQVKAKFNSLPYNGFYFQISRNPHSKYLWMFPLSEKEAYVGYASQNAQLNISQVEKFLKTYNAQTLQKQAKLLRLNPPQQSLPITNGKILGVGNTIGAITSLGEGNALSAITADILLQNLDNPQNYTQQVLKLLKWLKHDYAAYNSWLQNKTLQTIYHTLKIQRLYRERFKIPAKQLLQALFSGRLFS
jgi:flavin-dependent dehydrogenase